ncbi:MAG: FeoB small GTPase domain-containing protein [Candidatus Omnitrophota bacterium]
MITLVELKSGERGIIKELQGGPGLKRKLESLGIRAGGNIRKISEPGGHRPAVVEINGSKIAIGYGMARRIVVEVVQIKILLVGNPNVGKSVVFSRLTGLDVISSNYPGTTVEYTHGTAWMEKQRVQIIDVPGAYTLEPTNKAEEVASGMLSKEKPDLVINVVDATNLERNLYLTLQILEKGTPVIILLNKWDMAKWKGIIIDLEGLSQKIGVEVVPFVAVTGEGIKKLQTTVKEVISKRDKPSRDIPPDDDGKWKLIGEISRFVQKTVHKHPSFLEKLADACTNPLTGFPIALIVLAVTFFLIRSIGEGMINHVLNPFFYNIYHPFIAGIVNLIFPAGILQKLLLGTTPKFMESFGVLTTGVYIPFVIVLPYILSFYFVLSFLEDLGYLPRLAVLLDGTLHRFGLHGYAAIPVILGLGCKVPAMMSARILETRREKIIAMALIMMIAPCMPQSAMIISILGRYGLKYLAVVFGMLLIVSLVSSSVLNRLLKGETPELFVEIPAYQMPRMRPLLKKLWMRVKSFIFEAVPLIILGILFVNILDISGFIKFISKPLGPVIANLLGLPKEISSVLLLGFLRKDIAIALLIPFNLSGKQLIIASTFLVLYLPCFATFFVLLKEIGAKDTFKIVSLTFLIACLVGVILNLIL